MQNLFPEEYNFYPRSWILPDEFQLFVAQVGSTTSPWPVNSMTAATGSWVMCAGSWGKGSLGSWDWPGGEVSLTGHSRYCSDQGSLQSWTDRMTGKLKKWVLTPGEWPEDGYQELNHGVRAFEEPGRHSGSRQVSPQADWGCLGESQKCGLPASCVVKHGRSSSVSRPGSRSYQWRGKPFKCPALILFQNQFSCDPFHIQTLKKKTNLKW